MRDYDNFAKTFSNSRKNMHWPEIDTIIEDIKLCNFTSILDVGCGNGRFLCELRKELGKPAKYIGIDSSGGMVEEAKKLYPDEDFRCISMLELEKLEDGEKFDAIVFLASFHHLSGEKDRRKCLIDLKPLLNPEGKIYITNWNLLGQKKYESSHKGNGDFQIKIGEFYRYYHGFTLIELESLFLETGWKIYSNKIFEGGRNIFSCIKKNEK